MSQKLCYRPIKQEEIPIAKEMLALHYPWVAEPDWTGIWVRDEEGRMTGFVGFQRPVIVEPMWCESASAARDLMNWVDGSLSPFKEYEFFVADNNGTFQRAVEKHFGLEGKRELPGNHYFVKRQ